jgi:uncharacterized protein HemX
MAIEYLGVMIPILAIVLGISLGFFGVWTQHKQKLAKLQLEAAATNGAGGAEHEQEIRELRDRVQVLERIVTDGSYTVASQIEALRDRETESQPKARV